MDPNACFQRLLEALDDRDMDELAQACADLIEWLKRDGFAPDVSRSDLFRLISQLGMLARSIDDGSNHG